MGILYIDDFVKEKGFDSTEEYLKNCIEKMRCPHFNSFEYFKNLYDNKLIIEGAIIRTSDRGLIDRCYFVNKEGNLVGITAGPYPGEEGTFKPEDILIGKRISDGWTIENVMRFGYIFREWEGK
ncbi:MAG: hypothetical protein KJ623_01405 [Nanoarchaeota archaeon]|nr:hypothetical protein [Nanoarchaeota archaeon]MBU0963145.1 hypothetical protein [Nanoarchaeota archaeon]